MAGMVNDLPASTSPCDIHVSGFKNAGVNGTKCFTSIFDLQKTAFQ
jgi:hypothetical protein